MWPIVRLRQNGWIYCSLSILGKRQPRQIRDMQIIHLTYVPGNISNTSQENCHDIMEHVTQPIENILDENVVKVKKWIKFNCDSMCFCEKSTTEWKHKMLVLFWYAQTSAEVYVILKLKKWEPSFLNIGDRRRGKVISHFLYLLLPRMVEFLGNKTYGFKEYHTVHIRSW